MWRVILVLLALGLGIWCAKPVLRSQSPLVYAKKRDFPLSEHKSFVVVLYSYNQALWCERALRSIFEQDYDHYRVVFIDDASSDGTAELAKKFMIDHNQTDKVLLIVNEKKMGKTACLYRAIDHCLDREIVVEFDAKDWLVSPNVLSHLNAAYQDPDVWLVLSNSLDYPSYDASASGPISYYAALFKQIGLSEFLHEGKFTDRFDTCLSSLMGLSSGRIYKMEEPLLFSNKAIPAPSFSLPQEGIKTKPLSHFPKPKAKQSADMLVFSFDRPMQLYACLESIQRYVSGLELCTVLYRASNERFALGYEKLKSAFPDMRFIRQNSESDFQAKTEEILFRSAAKYTLFGADDLIVKDFVDLRPCVDLMEKTDAYGFYLRLGRHIQYCYEKEMAQEIPPSEELGSGIFAWALKEGEFDWALSASLDMTLYNKAKIQGPLRKRTYKNPKQLKLAWAEEREAKEGIGLYFSQSKLVSLPLNSLQKKGKSASLCLSTEDLLTKFNEGLKIDIEPLYRLENSSTSIDYVPVLIAR